ncbi:MoaD family protein [Candidatus Bathyarchaeota archaeon]|nr:MoaD family protein [Candidatus Bathyarchaeota archaeon]
MAIEIKFFTSLREITGKKVDRLDFEKKITIEELIILLSNKYGKKFKEYIYNNRGEIQDFLSFLINGKNINTLQGYGTKLTKDDIVAILPPVGGG